MRKFNQQIARCVAGELATRQFVSDGRDTFRRIVDHEGTRTTQIIEFQRGNKGSLAGRFTVNLAVFNSSYFRQTDAEERHGEPVPLDCPRDLTQRLGFFHRPRPSLLGLIVGRRPPAVDHWWRCGADPRTTERELADVWEVLVTHGLPWLDGRTSLASFEWTSRQIERRSAWNASTRSEGVVRPFPSEPFPDIGE